MPFASAIHYPNRDATAATVFTRDALLRATAQLLSWRQGPGAFGQLHLHACWGEASSLQRRYHGQTVARYRDIVPGLLHLWRHSCDESWRRLARDVVENILFLQTEEGGFYHASGEFEPSYDCHHSCPIHQGMPMLTLLEYAEQPEADPSQVRRIGTAFHRWWSWFESWWWRRGNGWRAPLPFAGFCGVTNQDLVIVTVLAKARRVLGDQAPYEKAGRPVLDVYLDPDYYHERLGLFERGDKPNFAERSSYHDIVVSMLNIVYGLTGDERLPAVTANVCRHLFEALHTGPDGMTHIAWGAHTDPVDKSRITGWQRLPYVTSGYPALLRMLHAHLNTCPDRKHEEACGKLERTLAAYTFADGTVPVSLGGDALFSTVGTENLWPFLIERLGEEADCTMDEVRVLPLVSRRCGAVTWKADTRGWSIMRSVRREFAGLKRNPFGVLIGDETSPAGMVLPSFEGAAVEEVVEDFYS